MSLILYHHIDYCLYYKFNQLFTASLLDRLQTGQQGSSSQSLPPTPHHPLTPSGEPVNPMGPCRDVNADPGSGGGMGPGAGGGGNSNVHAASVLTTCNPSGSSSSGGVPTTPTLTTDLDQHTPRLAVPLTGVNLHQSAVGITPTLVSTPHLQQQHNTPCENFRFLLT